MCLIFAIVLSSHVIGFLDHFRHRGPNGNHVSMVLVLGENMLGLINRYKVSIMLR